MCVCAFDIDVTCVELYPGGCTNIQLIMNINAVYMLLLLLYCNRKA